jgi:predicted GIY-YIG superfamily endonuclease
LDLPTLLSQHENQPKPKSTLSKKEKKLIRTQQKREKRKAERVQCIMDFGIHRAVNLIVDSQDKQLSPATRSFLKWMLIRNEDEIEFDNIHKVYGLLKKHGISLSYTANGHVISKSFTRISKTRSEQLLYVIRAKGSDFCKIGVSKDVRARKRELQTSNPHPLTISLVLNTVNQAVKLEKSLHKHFSKHRRQGEWFEGVDNETILRVIGKRAEVTNDY